MSNNAPNEDSDTEEVIIYADFGELLDESTLDLPDLEVGLIGIDSDTPILQLGGHLFRGKWDEMMGTAVIFEESYEPMEGDPVFDVQPEVSLQYLCKTNKTLNMERIFIEPKDKPADSETAELQRSIPTCSTLEEAFDVLVKEAEACTLNETSDTNR